MSFLSRGIALVVKSLEGGSVSPQEAVARYERAVLANLDQLDASGDLRIHDLDGGVLRGPKSSRASLEDGIRTRCSVLRCQEAYLTHGTGGQPTEVPYFRAVFNTDCHVLSVRDGASVTKITLIGYETPLMRKKTKEKNKGISGRCISCDLVGLDADRGQLWCIEGKTDPDNKATRLDYALLEAYAYGLCLHYHASDPLRLGDLKKEIALCLEDFHESPAALPTTLSVQYMLAMPRSYIAAMTPEFARRRTEEASRMEALLRTRPGPVFGGYLLLGVDCRLGSFDTDQYPAKQVKGKPCIVPAFRNPLGEAVRYRDIRTAMEAVRP